MEAEEKKKLRQLGQLPAAPTAGTIITVFGAKGGVGKSHDQRRTWRWRWRGIESSSVCIVDLDNGFGDIAGMLDVKPERTIADMVRDIDQVERDDISRYVSAARAVGARRARRAAACSSGVAGAGAGAQGDRLLARTYDKVVLDTSGMLNELAGSGGGRRDDGALGDDVGVRQRQRLASTPSARWGT